MEAAKDPGGFVDSLTGGDNAGEEAAAAAEPQFPGSDRLEKGRGKKVTAEDAEEVESQQAEMTIKQP